MPFWREEIRSCYRWPPVWSKKALRQQKYEHELRRNARGMCVSQVFIYAYFWVIFLYICNLSVHASLKCSFIITSDSTLCARLLQSNEFSSNIDRRELRTCKSQGRRAYPRSSAIIKKGLARHSAWVGKQYQLYIHVCYLSSRDYSTSFQNQAFSSFSYPFQVDDTKLPNNWHNFLSK